MTIHSFRYLRVLISVCLLYGTNAFAQSGANRESQFDVRVAGLLSAQPINATYADPAAPYLDKGLGGGTPGVLFGVSIAATHKLFVGAEFSTVAPISRNQRGRNVGGQVIGKLRDRLLYGLVGLHLGTSTRPIRVLGGIGRDFEGISLNDVPIETLLRVRADPLAAERSGIIATAGFDYGLVVTRHVSLVSLLRYTYVVRNTSAVRLGVGSNIFRGGVGMTWSVR